MFLVVGMYRGRSEVVDETDNEKDAEYLRAEYALAFGRDWSISIVEK